MNNIPSLRFSSLQTYRVLARHIGTRLTDASTGDWQKVTEVIAQECKNAVPQLTIRSNPQNETMDFACLDKDDHAVRSALHDYLGVGAYVDLHKRGVHALRSAWDDFYKMGVPIDVHGVFMGREGNQTAIPDQNTYNQVQQKLQSPPQP